MTATVAGGLIGLVVGVGLLIVIFGAPPARPIRLGDRLAPYLREVPRPSALLSPAPSSLPSAALRVLLPRARNVGAFIDKVVGGRLSVQRRLRALESDGSVEDFRLEQVLWGGIGVALGFAIGAILSVLSGQWVVASVLLLAIGGAVGGVLARDWWLTKQVRRRDEQMLAEFPVVADLLALAVTAGESPIGAIERVTTLVGGELGRTLGRALADARAGVPLAEALQQLADRSSLEPLARFVDGVVVAIERGTPLAEVLRAQAVDVREAGKRRLLEAGGKKEIAMMVPVVFLVLPVTVVFALYPGLFAIVELSG